MKALNSNMLQNGERDSRSNCSFSSGCLNSLSSERPIEGCFLILVKNWFHLSRSSQKDLTSKGFTLGPSMSSMAELKYASKMLSQKALVFIMFMVI